MLKMWYFVSSPLQLVLELFLKLTLDIVNKGLKILKVFLEKYFKL